MAKFVQLPRTLSEILHKILSEREFPKYELLPPEILFSNVQLIPPEELFGENSKITPSYKEKLKSPEELFSNYSPPQKTKLTKPENFVPFLSSSQDLMIKGIKNKKK